MNACDEGRKAILTIEPDGLLAPHDALDGVTPQLNCAALSSDRVDAPILYGDAVPIWQRRQPARPPASLPVSNQKCSCCEWRQPSCRPKRTRDPYFRGFALIPHDGGAVANVDRRIDVHEAIGFAFGFKANGREIWPNLKRRRQLDSAAAIYVAEVGGQRRATADSSEQAIVLLADRSLDMVNDNGSGILRRRLLQGGPDANIVATIATDPNTSHREVATIPDTSCILFA